MKLIYILAFILIGLSAAAQPVSPADYSLTKFTIQDKKLGIISFYVDTVNLGKRPLFFDINGSGGFPLCLYIESKNGSTVSNTFNPKLIEKVKEAYNYVVLDKPGTAFSDTIQIDKSIKDLDMTSVMKHYKASEEYTKRLSLEWRVESVQKVITFMIRKGYWDKSKLVVYGYSEGGQVVPKLAVTDKRITHVISVVGSGLNQFYDDALAWRLKAAAGDLTQNQAQDSLNSYFEKIKEIYKQPNDVNKEYQGHSYKRWASFCSTISFEELRKLKIPIYMIVATADSNSPVYGLDYVLLDFIRLGKANLTYDPCIGCDHFLSIIGENSSSNNTEEYFAKILQWIKQN